MKSVTLHRVKSAYVLHFALEHRTRATFSRTDTWEGTPCCRSTPFEKCSASMSAVII